MAWRGETLAAPLRSSTRDRTSQGRNRRPRAGRQVPPFGVDSTAKGEPAFSLRR